MILIDLNQVMISNMMAQLGNHASEAIEEDLFRHMVLNSIRSYRNMYRDYGEVVIACDDKKYWRRMVFPYYKHNRKKAREESDFDWNKIFGCLNKFRDELKDYFPYRVIQVEGAEADDVIATLCIKNGSILDTKEKIIILSGDKDFMQLQVYANVEQFDPVRKRRIKTDDPHSYLRQHILKGDRGDGIPNIYSPDECIANGERQKPLPAKRIEYLSNITDLSKVLSAEHYANFKRNEQLIDLHVIPTDIQEKILASYEDQADKPRDKMMNYFMEHKLRTLIEHIGDF
jgi:5'-3' exonuclease, N-terminal resolvase-like domain/T4 RNase H, C terminal